MEKITYETLEYVPANADEADSNQYLVVQDDNTFIFNRQVQYVAHVEDVPEKFRNVYDVTSQQYFVDVENSTELISVSDQFVLPDDSSNLYTSSYLLQPVSNENTTQMEEDVSMEHINETNIQAELEDTNQSNPGSCTEVTLSDDQFQMLEEKGWLLLEINEKVYILDTLGLHDITSNDKLIEKLKNETQNIVKAENQSSNIKIEDVHTSEKIEYVIENGLMDENEADDNIPTFIVPDKKEFFSPQLVPETFIIPPAREVKESINYHPVNGTTNNSQKRVIKMKTKLSFKDLPDKIVLGKTINGKNLVAKVLKRENVSTNVNNATEVPKCENIQKKEVNKTNILNTKDIHLPESTLIDLISKSIRGQTLCKTEDVAMVETIIKQIMQVLTLKSTILGRNLVITKTVKEDVNGVTINYDPTLITGKLTSINESGWCFIYIPDMLKSIVAKCYKSRLDAKQTENIEDHNILHIHVSVVKHANSPPQVTILLKKRDLPINNLIKAKKLVPNIIFGCTVCAAVFPSEKEIRAHQLEKGHSISTEKMNEPATQKTESDQNNENAKVFKCKMCPKVYMYSSSLMKHIVTCHIQRPQD